MPKLRCYNCESAKIGHCTCGCGLRICLRCGLSWMEELEEVEPMSKTAPKLKEPEDQGHPSQCQENRFPVDQMLRVAGFVIHERRNDKEAVWTIGGDLYGNHGEFLTESEAVLRLQGVDEEKHAA